MNKKAIADFVIKNKRYLTILLGIASIGVEVYYTLCDEACSYLRGDLFNIPLEYIGIGYMILIIFLSMFKKDLYLFLFLSIGVGIELYLIGFQIWHNVYCIYCLTFGGILILIYILNFNRTLKKHSLICAIIGLILFAVFFRGYVTPTYADEVLIPEFGKGHIKVRLYTDYFCPPCRKMEPKIEPLIEELIEKNKINITFVDAPFSSVSVMYARYFLYILNEKKDLNNALLARSVLIGAALNKIKEPNKIEEYLKLKGIKYKFFDTKPTFDTLNNYLKTDRITSTPTCVIIKDNELKKYTGEKDILNALEKLKE